MGFRLFILCLCWFPSIGQRPNIIFIMSDDHDADAISAYNPSMIHTLHLDRLATEGMRFTSCFVGNSICSPARATILTGQHSHLNGVKDNRTPFDSSRITLPKILRQAGYQTALIGKWHLHSLPSGFDYWNILPGQGAYHSTRFIYMNGDTLRQEGYSTRLITEKSIDWLKNKRDVSKPFFLMMHHKAPHRNWVPELKWLEFFSTRKIPEPASLYADTAGRGSAYKHQLMRIAEDMTLCSDLKVDPDFIRDIPHLKPTEADARSFHFIINSINEKDRQRMREIYAERGKKLQQLKPAGHELLKLKYQWYMQDYLACVASVDESAGTLMNYLQKSGLEENTIIIYTSDQGFYLGENGWFDKRFMYDVSMQTPLLIKWKGKIKAGSVSDALVQNIDFTSTILDMAGTSSPEWMQGLSLVPILTGKQKSLNRDALYYHYYEYPVDHRVLPHLGIREKKYKLIYFYTVDEWELYDMENDPAEQNNLATDLRYGELLSNMKQKMAALKKKYKDDEPAGVLK